MTSVEPAGPRLPDFVVMGTTKSATTTLHFWLDAHPEVYVPPEKELHFFDRDWNRGVDWYREQFADATTAQTAGETTPRYLCAPAARRRMTETLPEAKFLAILRHPVDRAWSHYWMQQAKYPSTLTFGEVIELELAGKELPPPHAPYIEEGRYHSHLVELFNHVEPDRVLLLLFDDLRDDPSGVFSRVCRFLGVDATYPPRPLSNEYANVTRPVRSRWLRLAMLRLRLGKLMPGRMALRLDSLNRRSGYPPMPPELRQRLLDVFREDTRRLADRLGRPLPGWDT